MIRYSREFWESRVASLTKAKNSFDVGGKYYKEKNLKRDMNHMRGKIEEAQSHLAYESIGITKDKCTQCGARIIEER